MTVDDIAQLARGRHPSWRRAYVSPPPAKPMAAPPGTVAAFLSGLFVGLGASVAVLGWTL